MITLNQKQERNVIQMSLNFNNNVTTQTKEQSKLLDNVTAKPFIKWAGGKTKLIPTINDRLPDDINNIKTYIEPFVGAGSVFMYMAQNYDFERIVINDINAALIAIYKNIRDDLDELTYQLDYIQNEYQRLPDIEKSDDKKNYYLKIRELYNTESRFTTEGSARFIFLNKYGFNGLYRENAKGQNNVGFGKKNKAELYDLLNLQKLNQILNSKNSKGELKVIISNGDYMQTINYVSANAFIYMDPPYRPVTNAGFTNYHKSGFNDDAQIMLSNFFVMLHCANAKAMISNSDPKVQVDAQTPEFFDDLYNGHVIERVSMRRNINSKGSSRGPVNELLIRNYLTKDETIS